MLKRRMMIATATLATVFTGSLGVEAIAQDVPGIEICTAEKTMERRTGCLQSNIDFLMRTIRKLSLDQQQKIDAANRQIDALKATVAGLQKRVEELQAAKETPKDPSKDSRPKEPAAK